MAEPGRPTVLERVGSAGATAASLGGERSRWRKWAVLAIAVLAVVFLVYTAARNWSRLPEIEWRFEPVWLVGCVLALLVFQAIQAQMWVGILRALGGRLATARGWWIWSATMLARYIPTNLAMVVGRTAMAERDGVAKRVTMASTVYQLGVAFAGATAVGAYFVIELPGLQGTPVRFAALALPVAALVALDPRIFHRLADHALKRLGREPLPVSLPRSAVLLYTAVAAVSFVIAGVAVWAFTEAIHPIAADDIPTVIGAYSVGFAISVLTIVLPGGLGAREGAMVAALSPVMPVTVALAVSIAIRLLQIGIELLFATITPVWARRSATAPGPA
ncbi:MAG TPA: lysylphosphatidylglycerol synthase domain-containing protein [Solirubrobacteraceae bacterium]|nr:lysylphosphatidylglycerol synthase domain-containing protein [Solirubrobacteraceae bacterium]